MLIKKVFVMIGNSTLESKHERLHSRHHVRAVPRRNRAEIGQSGMKRSD
jgi:hypothetical protein